jgi:Domain of unknown function (DUF4189)
MRSAFVFIATIIFGTIDVFGSPATRGTHSDIIRTPAAPQRVREPDVQKSVNDTRSLSSLVAPDQSVWACIVVSSVQENYGYGYGASQGEALTYAQNACGSADCTVQICVTGGCAAYAAGPQRIELYESSNDGSWQNDATKAQNDALVICQAYSTNCKIVVGICTSNAD